MEALVPISQNTPSSQPLYAIEEYLATLVDTLELVPPDQEERFLDEFRIALSTAVEKRDRVGQFMSHIEHQIAFANTEIDRLRERKATYQRALDRIERYVINTIELLGKDTHGKHRRLEGTTITFSLAGCPPSVEVTNESAVPAEYKTLTLKLPAIVWDQIIAGLEASKRKSLPFQVKCHDVSIDKRSIKAAIQAGAVIPGAALSVGKTALRRI